MIKSKFIFPILFLIMACQPDEPPIKAVTLHGGAYVIIENKLDSTSLAEISNDIFSLEIWAAGDTLPSGGSVPIPALFMISNSAGANELAVYRSTSDSTAIMVFVDDTYMGRYSIPGCDWTDRELFTQVVITYDGADLNIYGNGTSLGTVTVALDLEVDSSAALIGADWDAAGDLGTLDNFWYGSMDEVRLWRIALPASEMEFRYKYRDKLTRNYSPTGLNDLIGLWRFNTAKQDGDTVEDGGPWGNDAVIRAGNGQLGFTNGRY